MVGSDVNNFDEPWALSYQHGMDENVALYASAEDGMPRTFAFKEIAENTSSFERWNLYLCDRYDTGTIALSMLDTEEIIKQIQERISFEIVPNECKIEVYDNGKKVGSIEVAASASSMEKIKEVVCDGTAIAYSLGKNEEEIRMFTRIGLKKDESDDIWYRRLSLLSFTITCGSFGERNLQLGEVSVDEQYVSGGDIEHSGKSIDEWIEESKEMADTFQSTDILAEAFQSPEGYTGTTIQYQNPCPAATRISDTFGERMNPMTKEIITHAGIDLAAAEGSDVLAAADGAVISVGFNYTDGNYVMLFHGDSECTYYAACQEILVSEGDKVSAGDKIATVGSTGRSTGPHLHFSLSRNGVPEEPVFVGLEEYE
ncbi:MAG: M23 family metallopeptidase [Lachnospiraceae bacterium]|nr:M23 family metallopeptidase [Lachnospiraceae bacterium]